MGVNKTHLVPIALGNPGDQILYMTDGSADGSNGLARSKPCFHLQLLPSLEESKVKVEVFEVAGELAAGTFDLNDLRVNLHGDPFRDVHRLGGKNCLHLAGADCSAAGRVTENPNAISRRFIFIAAVQGS